MQSACARLTDIRRPRLLVRAARLGLSDYRPGLHLPRLLENFRTDTGRDEVIGQLMSIEDDLDQQRRNADAAYSLVRHVDVLIALMGEARILAARAPDMDVEAPRRMRLASSPSSA